MKDYIEISFGEGTATNELLLAALAHAGFEGFEENEDRLNAFIPADQYDEDFTKEIAAKFGVEFSLKLIKPVNWNEQWESGFEPVCVGNFAAIRANFHPPVKNVMHEIVITPKMSFGTGHHATTYLMIESMGRIDFSGKKVLDFGTGTGILAILAEKCGATEIVAIDNDEWSIANARENIANNECRNINLVHSDFPSVKQTYDVILANINRNVIEAHLPTLVELLHPRGVLLLSGLLLEDETTIDQLCKSFLLKFAERTTRQSWLCLRYYK